MVEERKLHGPHTVYILAGEERRELLIHLELDRSLIKDAPGPCTEPVGRRPGTGPTPFPGLSARNRKKDVGLVVIFITFQYFNCTQSKKSVWNP